MKENVKSTELNTDLDRLDYKISLEDMLLDLKVLLKEYYCATFSDDGKSLKITLSNGQKFLLSLTTVWRAYTKEKIGRINLRPIYI